MSFPMGNNFNNNTSYNPGYPPTHNTGYDPVFNNSKEGKYN